MISFGIGVLFVSMIARSFDLVKDCPQIRLINYAGLALIMMGHYM